MRPASPALTFRRRTEAGVSPTPRTTPCGPGERPASLGLRGATTAQKATRVPMREEAGVPAAGWIPVDSPGPWGSPAPRERRAPKLTPTCASQTCHSFCASFRRAPPCHAPAWPARQDCPRRRSRPWWPSCAHGDCSSRRSPTCPATSADRATPCATPPPWGGTTSPSRSGSVTRSLAAWAPAGTSPPSPRCQARRTGHLRTLCAGRGTQPALPVGRGGDRLGIIDDTGAVIGGEFSGARPCAVTSPARTGSMPAPCWSRRWQPQASGSPSSTPYRGQVRRARHG